MNEGRGLKYDNGDKKIMMKMTINDAVAKTVIIEFIQH